MELDSDEDEVQVTDDEGKLVAESVDDYDMHGAWRRVNWIPLNDKK